MAQDTAASFLFAFARTVDVSLAFSPVYQVPFSVENSHNRKHGVVVRVPREALLNGFNRGLTKVPDDPHNLRFFFSKCLGRLSRHSSLRKRNGKGEDHLLTPFAHNLL